MTIEASLEHAADVLIVDDNMSLRKIVRFALEDAGYTVYEASDGVEGLDRLRTHPQGLVVLLDLNMPGLDGWGVLRAVAAETRLATRHRFLLVTAESEMLPSLLMDLLTDLHVPVIAKPCGLDHILDAVARAATAIDAHEAPGSASAH